MKYAIPMNDMYRRYLLHYSVMYKNASPYRMQRHYGSVTGYFMKGYDAVFNSEHAGRVSGVDVTHPLIDQDLSDLIRVD